MLKLILGMTVVMSSKLCLYGWRATEAGLNTEKYDLDNFLTKVSPL